MKLLPKNKIKKSTKFLTGSIIATAIVGAAGFWNFKTNTGSVQFPSYQVKEVIDGDTFVTKEKRNIRLASVSSPELDECGGQEAKLKMEELVTGKDLYIKVLFNDIYGRLVSLVYTKDGLVNEKMLQAGMAYYGGTANEPEGISKEALKAKENKVGIFGSKCTQETNPDNSKCIIKGNKRLHAGNSAQYRFPGCTQYNKTLIQLYLGDQWFCSEKEAIKAGFTKGEDCFSKSWP